MTSSPEGPDAADGSRHHADQAHPSSAATWRRPSRRLLVAHRAVGCGLVVLLGLPFSVALAEVFGWGVGLVPMAATLVAAGLAWYVAGRRWAAWGYLERADELLVRRGVLYHRLSAVPYGRMQFVDVTAGPVDRWLGLATVHLHTAAAATDAAVPGLPSAEAERLRDRLAVLGEARAAGL